jgi:protocatechuate 3,4-dioxygenase beta subunit
MEAAVSGKAKRLCWMLLLLFIILGIWWDSRRQGSEHIAGRKASSAIEKSIEIPSTQKGTSDNPRRDPSYISVRVAKLKYYERNSLYILTGRVTSEEGGPLPGAIVSLYSLPVPAVNSQAPIVSQSCDNEGRYAISLRSPMKAYVSVRREGFTQEESEIDFVVPETIELNHRLRPAPACAEGYILDEAGAPIAGALVSMAPVHSITDTTGKYSLRGLPEGNRILRISAKRFLMKIARVNLSAGDCQRLDVYLSKGFLVRLSIMNVRGEAIPGAGSMITKLGPNKEIYTGLADRDGTLEFAVPPDFMPLDCNIFASRYKAAKIRITSNDNQVPQRAVVLEDAEIPKQGLFTGRVIDESGMPVAKAKVQGGVKSVGTDEDGRFSVIVATEDITGSTFKISKPGYIPREVVPGRIEQPGGGLDRDAPHAEVVITLQHSEGGFYGRAVDESGNPVKRLSIYLMTESGDTHYREFDNDEGLFSIVDIPTGIYEVLFKALPIGVREPFSPRTLTIKRIEIRRGFYYGEIVARLSPD